MTSQEPISLAAVAYIRGFAASQAIDKAIASISLLLCALIVAPFWRNPPRSTGPRAGRTGIATDPDAQQDAHVHGMAQPPASPSMQIVNN